MQLRRISLFSVFQLIPSLCLVAYAQDALPYRNPPARFEAMKLLTADTGWAITNKKLFWITGAGAHWRDITPGLKHKRQAASSVFFLDTLRGWAILKCGDDLDPAVDDGCFEFASTTDSGKNWAIVHPKIKDPELQTDYNDWSGYSDATHIEFTDSDHGWAVLTKGTHLQACIASPLRTIDGGRTWTQVSKHGAPECNFHFITRSDGWAQGRSEEGPNLYVTHDAGETWISVLLKPPPLVKVGEWPPQPYGVWPAYGLPIFDSPEHGLLIASYWDGSKSTPVIFSTTDLGHRWRFERVLPDVDGVTTIFRNTLYTVSMSESGDKITLTKLHLAGKTSQPSSTSASIHEIGIRHYNLNRYGDAISMVSDSRGWLLADTLLATTDGGATWKNITPW
jgi:photosystem II stability/assembly factor-like uncharacterized protein